MKSILAAIAAFIRSMPRFVMQRVLVAGRWLQQLVAVPAPYEPEPSAPASAQHNADLEHAAAIRTAAAHMASGQVPPEMVVNSLEEIDFAWLATLPRPMLCKLATATDADLLGHIRGQGPIRGVLLRDRDAVREFQALNRRQREADALERGLELQIA